MKYQKNWSTKNSSKKIYILGIALICGFLLISADDCESEYLAEQQRIASANNSKSQSVGESQLSASKEGTGTAITSQQETQANTGGSIAESGTQAGTGGPVAAPGSQAVPVTDGTAAASGTQAAAGGNTGTTGTQTDTGGPVAAPGSQAVPVTDGTAAASGTQAAAGGTANASETQTSTGENTGMSGTQADTGGSTVAPQASAAGSTGAEYIASISGKSWKLTELRFTDRTVTLNRSELTRDQADFFTLNIDNERVSGRAAPNRYFTSYKAGADNSLTIQPIASTMMALIVTDPQRIQEPQYFHYLGKVKSWKINQNKLELTTTDAANRTLIMVFSS